MSKDEKDKFLIFGFLRKMLDKDQSKVFHERMKSEEFQEQVSEEAIHQFGRIQLQSKLDLLHDEMKAKRRKTNLINTFIFIAFVGLASIVYWKFAVNKNDSPNTKPQELFATYFDPYAYLFEQKGESSERNEGLSLAMESYSNQEFSKAVEEFEKYNVQDNGNISLTTFYYGISLLANNQPEAAAEIFFSIQNSNSIVPKEALDWYLALAYIKTGNYSKAKPFIVFLSSNSNTRFKQKEASQIQQILYQEK